MTFTLIYLSQGWMAAIMMYLLVGREADRINNRPASSTLISIVTIALIWPYFLYRLWKDT